MNAPDSPWESRRIDFTTGQGIRPTEREQIMERVKQELDRIEFQNIKPVDVKPLPSEQPKAKAETKGFAYKKDAPKQVGQQVLELAGKKYAWTDNISGEQIIEFGKDKRFYQINDDGKRNSHATWVQPGSTVTVTWVGNNSKIVATISESGETIKGYNRAPGETDDVVTFKKRAD